MTEDNLTNNVEQLQQEVVTLRQQAEEYRHLASVPLSNPVPIFEFDTQGQLRYLNPAAEQTLRQLGLSDARLFIPADFAELKTAMVPDGVRIVETQPYHREICLQGEYFDETIVYSPEYDTFRIFANDSTLRRRAEEALKSKTMELAQTQNFIEAVTVGNDIIIATVDNEYRFTYFNQAYQAEIKRLSGADLYIGMSLLDAFAHHPDLLKVVHEEWSHVLSGETTNKVLDFGDPVLYRRTYNVLHTPILDDQGQVVGAGEVALNITEQVQVQQALRDSETRYHSLFEGMTEGFAVHEIILNEEGKPYDYRFLDINPAFERLTGLKCDATLGKTYRQVLPDESDSWVNIYGKVVQSGEPVQFEQFSSALNKYFEVFAYRYAPNQFATIFMDITAHKKMEDELRINLTKYSVLFENLPLGVTVSDDQGRILESNPEAARLLGLAYQEQKKLLINGPEWQVIRPDRSPMPPEEFASVRALSEKRRIENVEMGIVKGPDEITWISVTASPLPLPNYGVVITYNDISQRIQAEEALHRAHEQLEQTVITRTEELLLTNAELRTEIRMRQRVESELLLQTRAVEAERQRFRDVLEILPVYTILLTPDYQVSFANRYFRERFGEDHGKRCYEFLFGLNEPCSNCETYKVLKTGTSHSWQWTGPDYRDYEVFDFPFKDADGSPLILELGIDVTERNQAEAKLRSLNTYNRSLIEANLDALVTITSDGKIGDVNAITEAITGYPRAELIGTDFHTYFTNPEKARRGYEQVFNTGTVHDYELEIQHRDGHTTPVTYNASIFRDQSGSVAGVFAAARDITERKQTEKQLIILTTALEAAANGIILVDKKGTILWSNPAFSRMTGYSKHEVIGQTPRFLKSGQHDQEFYRNLWATILAGKMWRGEIVNQRKNGSLYNEEQIITPVIDQAGDISNFISIRQDITEHKIAEQALQMSEQQYRSLVIASSQIVWETNAQGEVVVDVPLWRKFTGQSYEECLGMGWINAVHPDDRENVAKVWSYAVKTKSLYDVEYRIKNRNNEYGHFAVRGVPIVDKEGTLTSWIGTSTDITEKRNYENQLIQAEKHAAIGRMVGSVTHEINNPLQTIKNCLYLLQQDVPADSEDREPLDMAISETQRLSNIVGQLRQLYRPHTLQSMQSYRLTQIISEVHSLIIPHLKNSHVVWKEGKNKPHDYINCIKDQIIEVFLNISLNAIEAMQATGGTLSVDVLRSIDQTQVGVVFTDTGPGIKPEILSHIFEPFITTKEYGLGLGLSICYGIIQKHAGQINVESQPGQGTSFTIWLPRLAE